VRADAGQHASGTKTCRQQGDGPRSRLNAGGQAASRQARDGTGRHGSESPFRVRGRFGARRGALRQTIEEAPWPASWAYRDGYGGAGSGITGRFPAVDGGGGGGGGGGVPRQASGAKPLWRQVLGVLEMTSVQPTGVQSEALHDEVARRRRRYRRRLRLLRLTAPLTWAYRAGLAWNDPFFGTEDTGRPTRRQHGIEAGFVIGETTGEFRDNQTDLLSSPSRRFRGRACTARGELSRSDGEVLWSPGRQARTWGARRFSVQVARVASTISCPITRTWTGVTITSVSGDELWLRVRSRDSGTVHRLVSGDGPATR
jgi:hypothetical protein